MSARNLILFVAILMMFSTSFALTKEGRSSYSDKGPPLPPAPYQESACDNCKTTPATGKRKAESDPQTNEAPSNKKPKTEPQNQNQAIITAPSHDHREKSNCTNMNQEDDRYPKAIPFPSCEEFVSWQDRCLHLDSSISSPILSPATEFPFNNKGELVKELIHDYNHHELKLVSYRDIVLGRGQPVNAKNLKVTFHYDLYNKHLKRVQTNALERSAEEVHLCWHRFGQGFEEGIRGMRPGGIRRVVVLEQYPPMVEEYGIFDVALLKVEISCSCPQPHANLFDA